MNDLKGHAISAVTICNIGGIRTFSYADLCTNSSKKSIDVSVGSQHMSLHVALVHIDVYYSWCGI